MSKLKPVLYYAFRMGYSYGMGYVLVAVTTEKAHSWYGREVRDDSGTHGSLCDLKGKFETLEAAEAAKAGLIAIREKYKPMLEQVERERKILWNLQATEERWVITGEAPANEDASCP